MKSAVMPMLNVAGNRYLITSALQRCPSVNYSRKNKTISYDFRIVQQPNDPFLMHPRKKPNANFFIPMAAPEAENINKSQAAK